MKTSKIVKENQPRPLANSGTKASGHSRFNGRRKLEFRDKLPLTGKRIYLDLKGTRQEKNLEDSLQKLGAIIEKFLSKEIHYLVTDQPKGKDKNEEQTASGSPNIYLSSPFNSGQTPSSSFDKKVLTVTRGKAMLQCAKMDSAAENIVDKAKKLGVKIVPYPSLMKWIVKEKSLIDSKKVVPTGSKKTKVEDYQKVRKITKAKFLKQPYIKFEANNKYYRPIQMEFSSWPHLNIDSALGTCPFDDWLMGVNPAKPEPVNNNKDRPDMVGWSAESEGQQDMSNLPQQKMKKFTPSQHQVPQNLTGRRLVNWERRKLAEKKVRQGFCECCEVRFEDVKKHLNSPVHCTFVKNETNYKQLDELITHGYNVQQFVDGVSHLNFHYHDSSTNDSIFSESPGKVRLLSLGSSNSVLPEIQKNAPVNGIVASPLAKGPVPSITTKDYTTITDPLNKDTIRSPYLKTPIKTPNKAILSTNFSSPINSVSNVVRSPFKCLLNSPGHLDLVLGEKPLSKDQKPRIGSTVPVTLTTKEPSLFSPTKEFVQHPKEKKHSKSPNKSGDSDFVAPSNQPRNLNEQAYKPFKDFSMPSLENFPVSKSSRNPESPKTRDGLESEQQMSNKNLGGQITVNMCLALTPPVLNSCEKIPTACPAENSPETKYPNIQVKRSLRCSSHKSKSKRQRLFKLGEKWQVLSQQSVKKILFSDESPDSFAGFDPQEIFRNDYSSDVSFETVSEVLLTDPPDFEWILGNCEGRRITDGTQSEPSSQTAPVHSSSKTFFTRDSVTDRTTNPERSTAHIITDTQKKPDDSVGLHVDISPDTFNMQNAFPRKEMCDPTESTPVKKASELTSTEEFQSEAETAKPYLRPSDEPMEYELSDTHNQTCQPSLPAPNIMLPVPTFQTSLIQDLDFPQNINFQCLDTADTSIYNYDNTIENCSINVPNSTIDTFQTLPYTNYSYLSNSTSLAAMHAFHIFPTAMPFGNSANTEIQGFNISGQAQQIEQAAGYGPQEQTGYSQKYENNCLDQDPNLASHDLGYENSPLPLLSVDRTLSVPEQDLSVSTDLHVPHLSTNTNSVYETLPVLNFESSFNLPIQNFGMLSSLVPTSHEKVAFTPASTLVTATSTSTSFLTDIGTGQHSFKSQCTSSQPPDNIDLGPGILCPNSYPETNSMIPNLFSNCTPTEREEDQQKPDVASDQHSSTLLIDSANSVSPSSTQYSSSCSNSSEATPQNIDSQTIPLAVGFVSLSNYASSDFHSLGLPIHQDLRIHPGLVSCPREPSKSPESLIQTRQPADNLCDFVSERHPQDEPDMDSNSTNSMSIPTPCDSLSDLKTSQYSSVFSSDPQASSCTSTSKSDGNITESLMKLPGEQIDVLSDEVLPASELNTFRNDSCAEIKDSGFLSIDELTPKKSPRSDPKNSHYSKKVFSIAKPCSVVLEKTPDTLLGGSLHKSVDQQNTFSVKRVDNNSILSQETNVKPRLLKRLSDNQKTFRLDYIHGGSGNRRSTSRSSAHRARYLMKQTPRYK